MKKIISFSLWGDNPKYTIGAVRNSELVEKVYPGWESRFYCGKSVPLDIIEMLRERGSEVILMDEEGDWTGMFWRFYPASESDVEVMISRDTDSRLSEREFVAVSEWLEGDKDFHIMRDHPYHKTAILGGMWGVRGDILKEMKTMIEKYIKGNFYQVDQNFLRDMVYPIVKDNSCVHDPFFEKRDFPTRRQGLGFVGQVFNENEETVLEHLDVLRRCLKD